MELIILIGLQASGKSTFFQNRFSDAYERISKDLPKNSKNKNQKQVERIERAFQEQHSVIIDNTNVTVHDRQALIDNGRRYNTTITGYHFEPDVTGSRTRNQKREGKAQVPEKVIFITVHKLEPPSSTEGFDALYYVRVEKNSTSEKPAWEIEEIPKSGLEEYNG